MHSPQAIASLLLVFVKLVAAHSWVEQLLNIGSDGSFMAGHGYPRGFVDKGVAQFDQNADVWLIPPLERQPPFVTHADLLCHPSQRIPHQTVNYPRLQTVPGGMIAMRYAENGHATIPNGGKALLGKPEKGGTVFVFGTQQPSQEEVLLDVLQWTRDGSGGDRRGVLLTSQNFDDERCYQLGNNETTAEFRKEQTPNPLPGQPGSEHELLCETDVRIPDEVQVDKSYTMYWVWQWPTAPRKDPTYPNGRDEYYTSCLEVDLALSIPAEQIERPLIQQDPMPSAVTGFRSRSALTADPLALYSTSALWRPSETQTLSIARYVARASLGILAANPAVSSKADPTVIATSKPTVHS